MRGNRPSHREFLVCQMSELYPTGRHTNMNIISESHMDHGLTPAQVSHLIVRYAMREEAFIETIELPEELGTLSCALRGPAVGDAPIGDWSHATYYQRRGAREYTSRLVDMPKTRTRLLTVIAGPHPTDLEQPCVLYTAFGGPLVPKEPGDPTLKPEERDASEAFWAEHALSESELVEGVDDVAFTVAVLK